MNLKLNKIVPYLLNPDISTPELVKGIKELSFLYTAKREEIKYWKWDENIITSYTSFYMLTNIPKFHFVMDQLSSEIKETLIECEVVEVGCGPGTYLQAFLDYFTELKGKRTFIGIDSEPMMLSQAKKLAKGLHPEQHFVFLSEGSSVPKKHRPRLVIFGNSLNEMGEEKALKKIKDCAADYILFLEPGTPSVFNQMLLIREEMIKSRRKVLYPCLSQEQCPVKLKIENGLEDWCHQVLRTTHEADIERFSQMAQLDRKSMAFIGHLYSRKEIDNEDSVKVDSKKAIMVRYINENKHCFLWEVCLEKEGQLALRLFEIPKKSLSKEKQKAYKKLSVGIKIEYQIIKELSESKLRVEIL